MSVYEELMVVKEGRDITKFLIRQKGNIISELLVITGGPGGNSLISIKGDLNMKSISDLSKNTGIQELKNLDKIEKKSPEE
jgi:phosphoribosyl-dephospho-CoA transferase